MIFLDIKFIADGLNGQVKRYQTNFVQQNNMLQDKICFETSLTNTTPLSIIN